MYISRLIEQSVEKALGNNKVLFLLGARQVGKTTLVKQVLSKKKGQLLNMDIDNHRERLLAASALEPIEAVRQLGGEEVLIIDEAQRVEDVGRICKGWYDMGVPVKIILLGSSSVNLLQHAASDLTGRNEKLWLTPLLFQEILQRQKWYHMPFAGRKFHQYFQRQIQGELLDRLIFGSYPEAYLSSTPRLYLANLSGDYLLKDIFASALVKSPEDVRRLLVELTRNIGQAISVLQLATRLNVSRQTIERYLGLLEAIFVIFRVPAFTTDPIKEVNRSVKYFFWDTGVINALTDQWQVADTRDDIELLWQNWIMAEIFKQGRTFNRPESLHFWQSRRGGSVDMVVRQEENLHPFDIRWDTYGYKPSRSFMTAYGITPKLIHPGNFLEFIL